MNTRFLSLKNHISRTIVGQRDLVDNLLVAILAEGHVLIEGVPGLAKTTAVRTLATGMDVSFQRIQFTPDLIPGDITGTDIFRPQSGQFQFVSGPIFHEVILADEINRAPPKVQSALLEAMQERQVTVGGVSRPLPEIFLVIATQNPLEHEGTFPLPEAQLDRFLMKINLNYPDADEELEILHRDQQRLSGQRTEPTKPEVSKEEVLLARRQVNDIYIDEMLERYIVTLVAATRDPSRWAPDVTPWLARGASPRATLALARTARAHALLSNRDFVEPGDIMELAYAVLNHRIALSFAARADDITLKTVVNRLVESVPVP